MQELQSGYVIKGKFEVGSKKGQGSLTEDIYHGRHLELERDIVIRILPSRFLADDESTKRFVQGIKLSAALQHHNILSVLDAGEDNGLKFLVTNFEKGFYLNEYLEQRGNLDEHESIRLIKGLADALDYAWLQQQIIHRNVCPDTILIAKGNTPMLTDFAMAKSLESKANLTLTGYAVGDPAYMSPEQAKGESVDFHSDIYCLGLVFYQLLAGHPPFHDMPPVQLMQAQIAEPHNPVQGANDNVTDACAAVIDKMLEKNTADRYDSWDDVVNDLDAILNQRTPSALKKGASKGLQDKIRRDAEAKIGKKYKKTMDRVTQDIANDTKRKFKRNIMIITLIINLIIIVLFMLYLKNKQEKTQEKKIQPPPIVNPN